MSIGAPLKQEEQGRGAVISGVVGAGPQLRLTTNHGHISVHKSTAENEPVRTIPKPPNPPAAPLKPQEQ